MAEDRTPAGRRSEAPGSNRASDPTPAQPETRHLLTRRWGEFVLLEEIGQGSFGTVYQAHDPRLDREVAVKLLRSSPADDQLASMLLHEGRTLARVRHPNVIAVYGAGEYDGQIGLCMELVRGVTLEQMLGAHGPFGAGEAAVGVLFFGARVANAASHLGAAWIAKRIGLVNTMVFTHIPSSLLLLTEATMVQLPDKHKEERAEPDLG